jgi:hypothetical protein
LEIGADRRLRGCRHCAVLFIGVRPAPIRAPAPVVNWMSLLLERMPKFVLVLL